MTACRIVTDAGIKWLIGLATVALILALVDVARSDPAHLSADGGTYYMTADIASSWDGDQVMRWTDAQDNIVSKAVVFTGASVVQAFRVLIGIPGATWENAKSDPLEFAAQAYVVLRATGNDPADWFDDEEKDPKGFKTPHDATATRTGDSRTGVAIDRHGCSVETSSSTTPITVDASFGSSGSAHCTVEVGADSP
jgi:hypothetical protein